MRRSKGGSPNDTKAGVQGIPSLPSTADLRKTLDETVAQEGMIDEVFSLVLDRVKAVGKSCEDFNRHKQQVLSGQFSQGVDKKTLESELREKIRLMTQIKRAYVQDLSARMRESLPKFQQGYHRLGVTNQLSPLEDKMALFALQAHSPTYTDLEMAKLHYVATQAKVPGFDPEGFIARNGNAPKEPVHPVERDFTRNQKKSRTVLCVVAALFFAFGALGNWLPIEMYIKKPHFLLLGALAAFGLFMVLAPQIFRTVATYYQGAKGVSKHAKVVDRIILVVGILIVCAMVGFEGHGYSILFNGSGSMSSSLHSVNSEGIALTILGWVMTLIGTGSFIFSEMNMARMEMKRYETEKKYWVAQSSATQKVASLVPYWDGFHSDFQESQKDRLDEGTRLSEEIASLEAQIAGIKDEVPTDPNQLPAGTFDSLRQEYNRTAQLVIELEPILKDANEAFNWYSSTL